MGYHALPGRGTAVGPRLKTRVGGIERNRYGLHARRNKPRYAGRHAAVVSYLFGLCKPLLSVFVSYSYIFKFNWARRCSPHIWPCGTEALRFVQLLLILLVNQLYYWLSVCFSILCHNLIQNLDSIV